jgi:hypothetical protein
MPNVTGKMAVLDCLSEINFLGLIRNLAFMGIEQLDIISINLSSKVEEDIFNIRESSPRVTFTEIGVIPFIELIANNTIDFF